MNIQKTCPYLGLYEDQLSISLASSPGHYCYAKSNQHSPDIHYQNQFCMTGSHLECLIFSSNFQAEQKEIILHSNMDSNTDSKMNFDVGSDLDGNQNSNDFSGSEKVDPSQFPIVPQELGWKRPDLSNLVQNEIVVYQRQVQHKKRTFSLLPLLNIGIWLFFGAALLFAWQQLTVQGPTPFGEAQTANAQVIALNSPKSNLERNIDENTSAPAEVPTSTSLPSVAVDSSADESNIQVASIQITDSPTPILETDPSIARANTDSSSSRSNVNDAISNLAAGLTTKLTTRAYRFVPQFGDVGWWATSNPAIGNIGDSFLYAGNEEQENFVSVIRFDLSEIQRGAPIYSGSFSLTGLKDNLPISDTASDVPVEWEFSLLAEDNMSKWPRVDYDQIVSSAALVLEPSLLVSQLAEGSENSQNLSESAIKWLDAQLRRGATSVYMRIATYSSPENNALFAWDSGVGKESTGKHPVLSLNTGLSPNATPTIPFEGTVVVATLTPTPQNELTAIAESSIQTAIAEDPNDTQALISYVTPTPLPENLATVQARAELLGLQPILQLTPTPASTAEATQQSLYATAVAQTTGTFTPVPEDFVTPVVVIPSPTPKNAATAVVLQNRLLAQGEQNVEWPWNGVPALVITTTPTPVDPEVAQFMEIINSANIQTTGTPTPTPWNLVIWTPIPEPIVETDSGSAQLPEPIPTALPTLLAPGQFTPTPTPEPQAPPLTELPSLYSNKILFKSDQGGREDIWLLDPATQDRFKVTQSEAYKLAESKLPFSPNGLKEAQVIYDANNILQIHTLWHEFGTRHQVSGLKGLSYDPAWSPTGESILFVSTDTHRNDEIYIAKIDFDDSDAFDIERLTWTDWESNKHPTWSPDGSQIIFVSNRSGTSQLWSMERDGSNLVNLSKNQFNDKDPVWVHPGWTQ